MSVSIDDDEAEGGEDARAVLSGWLDDYSEDRCELADLQEAFLSVCRRDPEASWDALALLDQYTRRGRIEPELAQALKTDIEKLVFGQGRVKGASPTQRSRPKAQPPVQATGEEDEEDTEEEPDEEEQAPEVNPQLRRLTPERDANSTRPGTAFIDRTLLRDESAPPLERARPARLSSLETIPAAVRRSPSTSPRHEAGGRVLRDRYELMNVLGRSASGTVYRAVDRHRAHLSHAARCVAVKVLNADLAGDRLALGELEREFHQAQSLAHPNIVSVFDLDRDGDTYFIVMELLEGELLASLLRKLEGRPMQRKHAFAIIGGVGAALEHAHKREIVHADLKPANIMITNSGEVRVLEFGFARNRAMDLHTASAVHEPSTPTPAYASVERVNGSEPDASDDVYSLACIAYELLTGQHPFGGRSALLARAHGRRPARPSGLTQKQWRALQRALLWTRGDRRIDVHEFLRELEGAPTGVALTPEDVLTPRESRLPWVRMTLWAACLLAAVAMGYYVVPQFVFRDEKIAAAPVQTPAIERESPTEAATKNEVSNAQSKVAAAQPESARQKRSQTPGQRKESQGKASSAQRPAAQAAASAAPGGTIQFDKDTYVATEGDGSVQLTVKRAGSTRGPMSFTWSLRGNSAEAGADFAAIGPGAEQVSSGTGEISLTIPLVSDGVVENTELFLVELHAGDPAQLGERSHAAVIIVDDD